MTKFPRKVEREKGKETEGKGKEGKERRRGEVIEWGGIYRVSQKKFPLLKIRSTKSTPKI